MKTKPSSSFVPGFDSIWLCMYIIWLSTLNLHSITWEIWNDQTAHLVIISFDSRQQFVGVYRTSPFTCSSVWTSGPSSRSGESSWLRLHDNRRTTMQILAKPNFVLKPTPIRWPWNTWCENTLQQNNSTFFSFHVNISRWFLSQRRKVM